MHKANDGVDMGDGMSGSHRTQVDAVVVGAGFSGLYLLHRLRELGLLVRVLEAAGGVGGTWYWNRYPGARCDIDSLEYGYSFSAALDEQWRWDERYATQPQILEYLNTVADVYDLRRDIQFNTRVASATYDEAAARWNVRAEDGAEFSARFCVMATGCLSVPKQPDITGVELFAGPSYFTSRWPHGGVDFTGQRVGVIGTGSSGIQSIPLIAEQADQLTVFQRTANFVVPAQNYDLDEAAHEAGALAARRASGFKCALGLSFEPNERNMGPAMALSVRERTAEFERLWQIGGLTLMVVFADLMVSEESNQAAADFIAGKIRERVKDPKVAEMLTPSGFPVGAKRLCVDINYYETFNRDNVRLVDLKTTPIEQVTPTGVRTTEREIGLDALVFATGFDAMTGALTSIDIRGRDGLTLKKAWEYGPRTYLGVSVAGFPNLFVVAAGPGSPGVLSNMRVSIEQHVDWITDCIHHVTENDIRSIEATKRAQDDWVAHVRKVGYATLFPRANSWYVGANVPGKPRVFMPYVGGVPHYRKTCANVAAKGYQGFELIPA